MYRTLPVVMELDEPSVSSDGIMESQTSTANRQARNPIAYRNHVPSAHAQRFSYASQNASQLAQALIRRDASSFFADNLTEMMNYWTRLLNMTALPRNVSYDDALVTNAFASLDEIISTESTTPLALRLAYVQLPKLIATVTGIIGANKRQGRLKAPVGKLNNSIAMELYSKAREKDFDSDKRQLSRRMRLAQRWVDIAGAHPLILVIYTEEAEKVISNFAITSHSLRAIAAETVRALPAKLIQASAYINQAAQLAIKPAASYNQSQLQECLALAREILSRAE